MENVNIYRGIVDDNILKEVEDAKWCDDLIQYCTYKCKMDGLIAAAQLFCPEIIQVKNYVFIKKFWNVQIEESLACISRLEEQFENDKKAIEMSVNTWSIGDFFPGESTEIMDNPKLIQQFGDALVYFWKMRVRELFPERNIIVELGVDLMGEIGLCITMYEVN